MEKQPNKNKKYQFETEGEIEVQNQILQSYQSGVVGQAGPNHIEAPHQEDGRQNQLR
ncbi:hypothetical protein ACJROX_21210 [Pseudalkalibacillus sp. A8]|uniref:hypothetical protein n=1 Tax=Pseudalkalibacillus sp. A8 TaxID=3382641 RepID=UPI0038B62923